MSKHTNMIWRSVVFSGAMLMTPILVGCGGGSKKPEPVQPADPGDKAASDPNEAAAQKTAADKASADKAAAEAAMLAEREAGDKKAADDQAAKEAADKKAAEELAMKEAADKKAAEDAKKKPRPRTTGKTRPTGRGFILS